MFSNVFVIIMTLTWSWLERGDDDENKIEVLMSKVCEENNNKKVMIGVQGQEMEMRMEKFWH